MKTELSLQQIEAYQRDGCLIVEDFLKPDELAALDAAVIQGVEEMGPRRITDESNTHIQDSREDTYYGRVFLQRLFLYRLLGRPGRSTGGAHMQSAHAGAVQTHFSFF